MVQVSGEVLKGILILASGNKEKHKGMGFTHGPMEIDIKVNSKTVLSMDKEWKGFLTEIPIKVSIKTVSLQVMGNIIGPPAVFSKEISRMG